MNIEDYLRYEPDTGKFYWIKKPSSRISVGSEAGSIGGKGYRQIGFNGRNYAAHRLAWRLMTGEWPELEVDHINGAKGDNRWDNLRQVS